MTAAELAASQRALMDDPPQALVLSHRQRAFVVHVLCHSFNNGKSGWRRFLKELIKICPVAWHGTGAEKSTHVCLGITYRGLLMQGDLPGHVRRILRQFAPAFCEGPHLRAAARLGDTGASASKHWTGDFDRDSLLGVVTLMHHTQAEQAADIEEIERLANKCTIGIRFLHGALIGRPAGEEGQWMHFGLRDGLTRVRFKCIEGSGSAADADPPVALGEVLLGAPREHGDNPWQLAAQPEHTRALFHHGSFGALRQVQQFVPEFERFVRAQADRLRSAWPRGQAAPTDWPAYVKAKLTGRWPDGRFFAGPPWTAPGGQPHQAAPPSDPVGHGCPFGAHMRRMNPGRMPDGARSVHVRTRVLVRRGLPYGPANWDGKDDGEKRGLLGHFFCSSLEDQFEHLLGLWAERVPLGLPDLGDSKDPLVGAHEDPAAYFEVPHDGRRSDWMSGFEPFVRTLGTAYAFYPGRGGLERLLHSRDLLDADDEERRP